MNTKGGQCMEKKSFIEYKGKPLVREGDVLYYGFPKEKYILRLDIFMKDANDNPTMVFATICPTNDQKKIVKQIGKMKGTLLSGVSYAGWGTPSYILNDKRPLLENSLKSMREIIKVAEDNGVTYCV